MYALLGMSIGISITGAIKSFAKSDGGNAFRYICIAACVIFFFVASMQRGH